MITRLRNYTFARRSRDKSSQPVPLPSYVRRLFLRGGRVAPSRSLDPKVIGFNLIGAPRYDGSDKADKGNGSITIVDHQRENLRDLSRFSSLRELPTSHAPTSGFLLPFFNAPFDVSYVSRAFV